MPVGVDFLDLPRSSAWEDHMANRRKSQLLTTKEAAEFLRLKPHTLENMRSQGKGPIFMKLGGRVFYHRTDLKTWL